MARKRRYDTSHPSPLKALKDRSEDPSAPGEDGDPAGDAVDEFVAGLPAPGPGGHASPDAPVPDAAGALADRALAAALAPRSRRILLGKPGLAVVVAVPGAAWVAPIRGALRHAGLEGAVAVARDGSERRAREAGRDERHVAECLSSGLTVVGISHAPAALLPPALVSAADLRIAVAPPSGATLRAVLRTVCGGRVPPVPDAAAAGLGFWEIVAALRPGTTARACLARLAAARAAAAGPGDREAPPALADLRGYGEAMDWALDLCRDVAAFRAGGPWTPHPAVLAGPPGTGKTLLVRALAREAGLPLVATSMGALMAGDGHLDAVCRALAETVSRAEQAAPAILFFDELDAVPSRSSGGRDKNDNYFRVLVTHFLTLLDGAASGASRIVLVGATNAPGLLDPALVRPGRFGRIVPVFPPDAEALAGILRLHLGDDLPGADLAGLAGMGEGATGAVARSWVERARADAAAAGRPLAFGDLLHQAAPPETRPAAMLRRIAVHEAGHAAAVHALGLGTLSRVSVVARGTRGGSTGAVLAPEAGLPTRRDAEAGVVAALAGRAAEEVLLGEASAGAGGGPRSDLAEATATLVALRTSYGLGGSLLHRADPGAWQAALARDPALARAVEAASARLHAEAVDLVRRRRAGIEALAEALVARRHLGGAEAAAILDRHAPRRRARRAGSAGGDRG